MNKTAIGYLTKDRVELSRRTIEPLLQPDKFDLHWFDGSNTMDGIAFPNRYPDEIQCISNVRGGPDAAVAYVLTTLLKLGYSYIGFCENDVLLDPSWFERTMALFDRGRVDGLEVGAVSARAYEDRILCQRDGYALMHNLGWGMQIMTRQAALLALKHFRTGHTLENRRIFAQLTGKDIGAYWAFRAGEHMLVADWQNDKTLAAHGLASLALTPSPVEMIGQDPPLTAQGLVLASEPDVGAAVDRDVAAFETFADRTYDIRSGLLRPGWCGQRYRDDAGLTYIFAHQVAGLEHAVYTGEWRLRFSQGFGPFAWRATQKGDSFEADISGGLDFMVSGGPDGGEVEVSDVGSGYVVSPRLPPEERQNALMHLHVPSQIGYRRVRLVAKDPGVCFYGVRCREPQPERGDWSFDHSVLPPVE